MVEKEFYKDNVIPEEDRMQLVLNIDRLPSVIKIRLGAKREPVCNDKRIAIFNSSGIFLNVTNITVLRIPAKLFGKSQLKTGDKIKFSVVLTTFARAATTKWEVDYHLSRK